MAFKVYWDEAHPNIIHNVYTGEVILDDYYQVVDETYKLIRSVDFTVNTILRYEDVTKRPANLLQVMRYASKTVPDNLGTRVVVAYSLQTQFTKVLINMARQMGLQLVEGVSIVDSLEDAYSVLASKEVDMAEDEISSPDTIK